MDMQRRALVSGLTAGTHGSRTLLAELHTGSRRPGKAHSVAAERLHG
jgi:hypothetical protein